MRKSKFVKVAFGIAAFALMIIHIPEVHAKEVVDIKTGIGGMSLILEEYYENRLSESGISISNVTTTFYVAGEKLEVVNKISSPYDGLAFSNTQDYVNIRKEPNTESEIVGKLYRASVANVMEQVGEWTKISSGKVEGYIDTSYLLFGEEAENLAKEHCTRYIKVTCTTLNVREGQGTDYKIRTQIPIEEKFEIKNIYDEWIEIVLDTDDNTGEDDTAFVSKDYVDIVYEFKYAVSMEEEKLEREREAAAILAEEEQRRRLEQSNKTSGTTSTQSSSGSSVASSYTGSEIVNYGKKFIGNPYVWGGTSLTSGADCSGFVQSVYRHFGITLPRVSRDMAARAGVQVTLSLSSMKAGDLIFYGDSAGNVNHVAIYIGNGQIVHAKGRKYGICTSPYNYRTPLKVRRVIK